MRTGATRVAILPFVLLALLPWPQPCHSATPSGAEAFQAPRPGPAPSLAQLRDAQVQGVLGDGTIQLRDGVYEGAPFVPGGASRPRVELLNRLTASGNLDSQPEEERVALLAASSGGSGVELYLAVFGPRGGRVANLGTILVGDRVQLRRMSVKDHRIVLDVVEAGPRDTRCCPTRLARKSYRLNAGGLVLISSEITGTLSLAALENVEWTLEETNGKPHPPDIEPPTLRVARGAVSGFGGCNRYQGGGQEKAPGRLAITGLASTMMACPEPRMGAEGDYLRDLRRASAYRFVEGRLALSFDDDGQAGVLLFAK